MNVAILALSIVACCMPGSEGRSCYECSEDNSDCKTNSGNLGWYVNTNCDGLCGYRCSGGVVTRTCSKYWWFPNGVMSGVVFQDANGAVFYFCDDSFCNNKAFNCASAPTAATTTTTTTTTPTTTKTTTTPTPTTTTTTTTTTATTTTTPLPPPAGHCYECVTSTQTCASNSELFSQHITGCSTGYCGYRCKPGELMQRVCSTTYYLPNLVVGSNFYADGFKYYFCTGENCNSGTLRC